MKLAKCSVVGGRILIILIRKTALSSAEKKGRRRRNTNWLSKFHLLSGFARLLLSHRPSSLRSRLKTSRSRFRSVGCVMGHLDHCPCNPSIHRRHWAVSYLGSRIRQLITPSFSFLHMWTNHQPLC